MLHRQGTRVGPGRARTARRRLAPVVVLLVAAVGLAGCGKDEFTDRTARVEVDGDLTTYEVDSCGLDGRTLFLVGRAGAGAILQAVVGLSDDVSEGVLASSGFTVGPETGSVGAFGVESWERRGRTDPPPGEVTSARLRGSRIQVAGRAVLVAADGAPIPGSSTYEVSIDARCDRKDDA